MSKFATGKNSYAISDRSGFRYRYKDMRKEWNGALVGRDEYEPKQPQLGPFRKVIDAQALLDARPDRTEPASEVLLTNNPFISGDSGSGVTQVIENGHGRETGDQVRFDNAVGFDGLTKTQINRSAGYVITVIDTEKYSITLTDTANTGGLRGGGSLCSVRAV